MANEIIPGTLLTTTPTLAHTVSADTVGLVLRLDFLNLNVSNVRHATVWEVPNGQTRGDEHKTYPGIKIKAGKPAYILVQSHLQEGDAVYWAADVDNDVRAAGYVKEVAKNGHERIDAQFLGTSLSTLHTVTADREITVTALLLANQDSVKRGAEIQFIPPSQSAASKYKMLTTGDKIKPNATRLFRWPHLYLSAGGTIQGLAEAASAIVVAGAVFEEDLVSGGGDPEPGSVFGFGTYADLAGITDMVDGSTFFFDGTDTPFTHAVYDEGDAEWKLWFERYECEPPDLGDFTWDNNTGTTAVSSGGAIVMTATSQAGSSTRNLYKAAPATPYTITALVANVFYGNDNGSNQVGPGLNFRQSSDGKISAFAATFVAVGIRNFTNATTFSASPAGVSKSNKVIYSWLRITDDGANRIYEVSFDGWNWNTIYTVARTTFLTADQVGFHVENNSTFLTATSYIMSWKQS